MQTATVLPFPEREAEAPAPRAGRSAPHHAGHRERLRERARGAGIHHLPDYELLELFLFRSQPQGDVKPIAKALLARFGSLAAVLAASVEDLMTVRAEDARGRTRGVGAETALDLTALHEVARRVAKEEASARTVISSWTALLAYVRLSLQHEPREQFRVLFLDNRNQLLLDEVQNRGTVDHAPVYPREVVRRALELSARNIIIVHNHPSGDPTPSRADIDMTRQVVDAARALSITVHDHLIVGREGVASFKQLGLM
ncbi:MAG: DNA repair protein RadC [Alphaproteobacteria bacterium]|nr:DNA repair protein RadC [Alphaproteobacteria bacterium]MBU1525369.1 DNA repair protein RadC [Alphaproteobacteria bacterium]MBU2352479.1 DNA repair protein RadC [Alphaproteobacteria bacterium]MBU2382400.1 DNA repair protein RadC [Alphaproteobacteria bacterium]